MTEVDTTTTTPENTPQNLQETELVESEGPSILPTEQHEPLEIPTYQEIQRDMISFEK